MNKNIKNTLIVVAFVVVSALASGCVEVEKVVVDVSRSVTGVGDGKDGCAAVNWGGTCD